MGATRALLALASCARHVLAERELYAVSMPVEQAVKLSTTLVRRKPQKLAGLDASSPFLAARSGFRRGHRCSETRVRML